MDKIAFTNQFNETIKSFTSNIDFLTEQSKKIVPIINSITRNTNNATEKLNLLNYSGE